MSTAMDRARQELAPNGTLRVGLNLSNFLLINRGTPVGVHEGIVPDLAQALAAELLADEPARAKTIAFSPAYLEIQATYLVPAGSPLKRVEDVDRPGVRIAAMGSGAYTLYLQRTLKHAELVLTSSIDESFDVFVAQKLEALSGLRTRLLADHAKLPGSTLLPGYFTSVQQAVGCSRRHSAAPGYLADFARRMRDGGAVQRAIDKHRVVGVNVAPAQG